MEINASATTAAAIFDIMGGTGEKLIGDTLIRVFLTTPVKNDLGKKKGNCKKELGIPTDLVPIGTL